MKLDIYVNYLGTCEEAFKYYEKHLGGKMNGISKHGEVPNLQVKSGSSRFWWI